MSKFRPTKDSLMYVLCNICNLWLSVCKLPVFSSLSGKIIQKSHFAIHSLKYIANLLYSESSSTFHSLGDGNWSTQKIPNAHSVRNFYILPQVQNYASE